MNIDRIVLRKMSMPLKDPFETSFGTIKDRSFMVVEMHSEGEVGYAEVVTENAPLYNEECIGTAWHVMETFLIPMLFKAQNEIMYPDGVSSIFKPIKRHYLAKSGLESAYWDLHAKLQDQSLSTILSGEREELEVGVSIGIQSSIPALLSKIDAYAAEGYRRIKLKIKPGWDYDVLKEVRNKFPHIPLMADANSAYTLQDIHLLKQLDEFDLMMVEQPLSHDDIIDHSTLQKQMKTPICLDESIHHVDDVRRALDLGSCKIINIKIGRVGGLTEAKKIHDYCLERNVPVWCGGMLEAGIGRAHNLAIASLSNFSIPGDTSPSSRYWQEDILEEPIDFSKPGMIQVPTGPGIGVHVSLEKLNKYTTVLKTYHSTEC
ncbi:o-succinylbenzoate synthase [Bacillus timonensis]|nr:o-succinylbenzoate synthase [Bacillus timonensis]